MWQRSKSCVIRLAIMSAADVFRMLFEFHRQQNAKKPGTVHATYLLSGLKKGDLETSTIAIKKDGEDAYMQSSPFMSSSLPQPEEEAVFSLTKTIELVREETLDCTLLPKIDRCL